MSVIKIINDRLSKTREPYQGPPKFRPSCLGSPCLRKVYYGYHRVLEDYPLPLRNSRITLLGDYIHDLICDEMRKAGVLIDYVGKDGKPKVNFFDPTKYDLEFPLKDEELEFSAKVDAVLLMNGELEIGEWKSINNKGFGYLKGAKPDHIQQAASYFFIMNQKLAAGEFDHIPQIKSVKEKEIKRVRLVYYNKDNSEMEELVYEKSQLIPHFKTVLNKMHSVKSHTNSKTLPPKTKDWCQSCSWRDKCAREFKIN